nr:ABC transporter substrate-binding protein [Veronia nyctiphanis]
MSDWPFASKNLKPVKQNVELARKLMREAGYRKGFKLTIHGPNNRYIRDTAILEYVATALNNIGIEANAISLPTREFFTRSMRHHEFSVSMLGWAPSASGFYTFNNLFIFPDPAKKSGNANAGQYHNDEVEKLVLTAKNSPDKTYRDQLYRRASEVVINDVAIIHSTFNTRVGVWHQT